MYGHGLSEMRFGEALRNLPRGSYQLSTKIGRYLVPCEAGQEDAGIFVDVPHNRAVYDYSYDGVMRSYEESLKRMGLIASTSSISTTSTSGPTAVRKPPTGGSRKSCPAATRRWKSCALPATSRPSALGSMKGGLPAPDRVGRLRLFPLGGRYTLLEQKALDSFLPICAERNIGIVLGGPYNSGILATGAIEGAIYNYHPAPPTSWTASPPSAGSATPTAYPWPAQHCSSPSPIRRRVGHPGAMSPDEVKRNIATLEGRSRRPSGLI